MNCSDLCLLLFFLSIFVFNYLHTAGQIHFLLYHSIRQSIHKWEVITVLLPPKTLQFIPPSKCPLSNLLWQSLPESHRAISVALRLCCLIQQTLATYGQQPVYCVAQIQTVFISTDNSFEQFCSKRTSGKCAEVQYPCRHHLSFLCPRIPFWEPFSFLPRSSVQVPWGPLYSSMTLPLWPQRFCQRYAPEPSQANFSIWLPNWSGVGYLI